MKPKHPAKPKPKALQPAAYPKLITGIGALLEEPRRAVAHAADCLMAATSWEIGRCIVEFEHGGKQRAEYGEELLKRPSRDLTERHGKGVLAAKSTEHASVFLCPRAGANSPDNVWHISPCNSLDAVWRIFGTAKQSACHRSSRGVRQPTHTR